MPFDLFGSGRRGGPECGSREGCRDCIDDTIEAEARFDECIEVVLQAWIADDSFSHRGQY